MNSFLKYIIYFLLGLVIYLLLKDNLIEGNENAFPFLARIMGQNVKGEYTTKYTGCHKYECDNIPKYSFEELDSKTLDGETGLRSILHQKFVLGETRLTDQLITSISKEDAINEILKIDRSNKYSTKEYNTDLDFLTCNNEMDYSPASMLGARCNHEKCCFNSKCSSTDVQGLPNITCGSGRTLKQDAHCIDEKNCRNKFVSLCCTEHNAIIHHTIKDIFLEIYNNHRGSGSYAVELITAQNALNDAVADISHYGDLTSAAARCSALPCAAQTTLNIAVRNIPYYRDLVADVTDAQAVAYRPTIDDLNLYLNGDFDDNSYRITGQNILDYINDPSVPLSSGTLSSDDLNNFLGTFDGSNPLSSKSYDIYDFNDLVKS